MIKNFNNLPAPLLLALVSALEPGMLICATSGTTIRVPVKSHLSPACACSTASARSTISTLN